MWSNHSITAITLLMSNHSIFIICGVYISYSGMLPGISLSYCELDLICWVFDTAILQNIWSLYDGKAPIANHCFCCIATF